MPADIGTSEGPAPAQVGAKLAYSVRDAIALTPYGYDSLLAFIESGQLPARRADTGKGKGKYVILHEDLVEFLKNLPVA
jgi:hypothetical protein